MGKSQNLRRRCCDHAGGLSAAIVRALNGVCPVKALCPILDLILRVAARIPRSSQRVILRRGNNAVLRNQCVLQIPADKIISRARRRRQSAIGLVKRDSLIFWRNRAFSCIKCHGIGVGVPLGVEGDILRRHRPEGIGFRQLLIRVPARKSISLARRRCWRCHHRLIILCDRFHGTAALGIKRDRIRIDAPFCGEGKRFSWHRVACLVLLFSTVPTQKGISGLCTCVRQCHGFSGKQLFTYFPIHTKRLREIPLSKNSLICNIRNGHFL